MRQEYYSKVEPDKLLHVVYRGGVGKPNSRVDIVPEDQFIQCARLSFDKGTTFRPHKHIWKPPARQQVIAQESWIVLVGAVKATFYDLDDTILAEPTLCPMDASFTFEGGHTYEILTDNTLVFEYKTGPYEGQELDKVFLDD